MQRWGHTSYHYAGSIYVFGGRSEEDLNDLLKIDPKTGEVSRLETSSKPQARRRHSGGFIGSCMVIFGGFDGSYFSDLIYINLISLDQQKKEDEVKQSEYFDHKLITSDKKVFQLSKGSIGKYFDS